MKAATSGLRYSLPLTRATFATKRHSGICRTSLIFALEISRDTAAFLSCADYRHLNVVIRYSVDDHLAPICVSVLVSRVHRDKAIFTYLNALSGNYSRGYGTFDRRILSLSCFPMKKLAQKGARTSTHACTHAHNKRALALNDGTIRISHGREFDKFNFSFTALSRASAARDFRDLSIYRV